MLIELMSALLSGAAKEVGGKGLGAMVLPIVILIAVFYFLMIRPESQKKKKYAQMRAELAVGDQITTIGGIVGTICAVKGDTIVVETSADRVRIEFTKWAVSTKGVQASEGRRG